MAKWHKGPPPHIGWWNASWCQLKDSWRWWDGKTWSCSTTPRHTAEEAAECAKTPCNANDIKWTNFYPENARVPRVRPDMFWSLFESATRQDKVITNKAIRLTIAARLAKREAARHAECLSDSNLKDSLLNHMERL